jgi:2-polyprenyl-3-methyl-5-hydroxy-6-metoxy-1,4-benzoquinol methylase
MNEDAVQCIEEDIGELLKAKRAEKTGWCTAPPDFIPDNEELFNNFRWSLDQAAANAKIDLNRIPVVSRKPLFGPIVTLYRRVVRKSMYWILKPLFAQVSQVNNAILDVLNKLILGYSKLNANMDRLSSFERGIDTRIEKKLQETESNLKQFLNQLDNSHGALEIRIEKKLQETESNLKQFLNQLDNSHIMQELENVRKMVTDYRSEAAFLRAKLAYVLQEIRFGKLPAQDVSRTYNTNVSLGETFSENAWIYRAFEQQFRGPELLIKERQHAYIPYVQKAFTDCGGFVLDMGAGRGEFLEICREFNIPAKGVDLNESMTESCRNKGLDVEQADMLTYLQTIPDERLCALTTFQAVEHLDPDQIWHLIQIGLLKLRAGGVIIIETVNSDSLFALKNFYLDLSHQRPVPSSTLQFLLEAAGFRDVTVKLSAPVPKEFQLEGQDKDIEKLNSFLFGFQDYAVVGWR